MMLHNTILLSLFIATIAIYKMSDTGFQDIQIGRLIGLLFFIPIMAFAINLKYKIKDENRERFRKEKKKETIRYKARAARERANRRD